MYEVREAATGEVIVVLHEDCARARSAFMHWAIGADEPLELVSPDGQVICQGQRQTPTG